MCANHHGLRSALVYNSYTAEQAVRHNCANFFSIPSQNIINLDAILEAIKNNSFDGGRHMSRMSDVLNIENFDK